MYRDTSVIFNNLTYHIMNRTIAIVVIIAILLGLGWWVFYTPKDAVKSPVATDTTMTTTGTTPGTTGSVTGTNTFKSIIEQKGSYQCTYSQASQSGQTISNIYIADGMLRGEFRDTDAVGNMMIYSNGTLYIWQEGKTVGTKTQVSTLAQLPTVIPKDLTSATSLGSGINSVGWDCHQWSKNAAFFIPSSQIKFTAN